MSTVIHAAGSAVVGTGGNRCNFVDISFRSIDIQIFSMIYGDFPMKSYFLAAILVFHMVLELGLLAHSVAR